MKEIFMHDPYGIVYTILVLIWGVIIYKNQINIAANGDYIRFLKRNKLRFIVDTVFYAYCVFMVFMKNDSVIAHSIMSILFILSLYFNYKKTKISEQEFIEKRKQIFNQ